PHAVRRRELRLRAELLDARARPLVLAHDAGRAARAAAGRVVRRRRADLHDAADRRGAHDADLRAARARVPGRLLPVQRAGGARGVLRGLRGGDRRSDRAAAAEPLPGRGGSQVTPGAPAPAAAPRVAAIVLNWNGL